MSYYKGWAIWKSDIAPVTGRWKARRFGVEMCANDEALLRRMIDQRVENDARWVAERQRNFMGA